MNELSENPTLPIHGVTTRYFYPNGDEVKENDIVFYSEDGGDHKFHYADSIGMIVKRGNDLKMKAHVITMNDAKTFQDYEEPEHNTVSLEYGQNMFDKNGVLPDFKKIGRYPKDKEMLSAEYAMEHYVNAFLTFNTKEK
jgi:hypothetical protein